MAITCQESVLLILICEYFLELHACLLFELSVKAHFCQEMNRPTHREMVIWNVIQQQHQTSKYLCQRIVEWILKVSKESGNRTMRWPLVDTRPNVFTNTTVSELNQQVLERRDKDSGKYSSRNSLYFLNLCIKWKRRNTWFIKIPENTSYDLSHESRVRNVRTRL
jgi:hypothetical protein